MYLLMSSPSRFGRDRLGVWRLTEVGVVVRTNSITKRYAINGNCAEFLVPAIDMGFDEEARISIAKINGHACVPPLTANIDRVIVVDPNACVLYILLN